MQSEFCNAYQLIASENDFCKELFVTHFNSNEDKLKG